MQEIINTFISVWQALLTWLTSFYNWMWDLERDFLLWAFDQSLYLADYIFDSMGLLISTWNYGTLAGLYAALPSDVASALALMNVPELFGMVGAAYVIRLTKDLILSVIP